MSALLILLLAGAGLAQHAPPQEFLDQQYYQPSSQHQGRNIDTGNLDNIDYSQYHSQPINFAPQEGWTHQVMELDNRDGHHYREQPQPVQGAGFNAGLFISPFSHTITTLLFILGALSMLKIALSIWLADAAEAAVPPETATEAGTTAAAVTSAAEIVATTMAAIVDGETTVATDAVPDVVATGRMLDLARQVISAIDDVARIYEN